MTDPHPIEQQQSGAVPETPRALEADLSPAFDFAAAYDAEFEAVWVYLRRLGVSEVDVEDAVHDVFVVAHRRQTTYDPARPLRPWLLGIAFRVAAQRRRQRHPEVLLGATDSELADQGQDPEDAVVYAQSRSRLHAALGQLTLDQRAVVVMHDLNGISVPEIAGTLDVPLNTVYSRLRLGRAKVAQALRGSE